MHCQHPNAREQHTLRPGDQTKAPRRELRADIMYPSPVTVPDFRYWKSQIKCQAACPVHTDARGYVRAIAEKDYERAYLIARGPNPLASICGRVCGAPCETECRRGDIDKPIAIRALKRFVCERFGSESRSDEGHGMIDFLKEAATRHQATECRDKEELLPLLQSTMRGQVSKVEGKSVGIIGSGPAGLAAAHDLALLGFEVTIYEMEKVLAGMLALGIPEYRLPRDLIRAEVGAIMALGVKAVTGCEIGKDLEFSELRKRHDVVIVAVGAKVSRMLAIPGGDAEGVLGGVEFLRDVALGHTPPLGRRVVVIGGGNVAYDVGRTVLRQISVDAARTALRQGEHTEVHLCSLESLEEMPADDVEIIEGDEEGLIRRNSLGPVEINTENGKVVGVTFRKCTRVFDENRQFSPLFDDQVRETIACDNVLLSVGQAVDLRFIDAERDGLDMNERGFVICDPNTGASSAGDVFIAGDLAYGPKLLIHAVASGKAVARAVYERVSGRAIDHRDLELHLAIPDYKRENGYEYRPRVELPTISPKQRLATNSAQVELCLSEDAACAEAGRCLDCGVNTIFDGEKCILCGGCVDVCPSLCLRIVSADRLSGNDTLRNAVETRLQGLEAGRASAIIKDESECIRCALCAERCPTGAITMERFSFEEGPLCRAV